MEVFWEVSMKKILSCIVILLLAASCFPAAAMAKTETLEINVGEGAENYVFQIVWENTDQEAQVEITSPDGVVYSTKETPEAVSGEGLIVFNVGAAAAGTWQVAITGEALGRVQVDGGELPGSMEIQEFQVENRGGAFYVSWKVLDCPESLRFQVFADTDADGFDGEEIASFTEAAEGEREIQLNRMDTGEYFLYLRVSSDSGIFTRKYADSTVSWVRDNAPGELSNVKACMLDGDVMLQWDEVEENTAYRVMIFDGTTRGLIQDDTVEGETLYLWTLPDQYDEVLAAVAIYDRGTGKYQTYPVKRSAEPDATVVYPEGDVINSRTLMVKVEFSGAYAVSAALNGELLIDGSAKAGEYRVDMKEGDNTIVFYLTDDAGNLHSYVKNLQVDTVPPQLSIQRNLDGLKTSDSYLYLEGHSEQGAQLLLNGQEMSMIKGYFNIRCDLSLGENQVTLVAKDAAGNETQYTAVITRTVQGGHAMYWFIGGAVFLVLLVLYLILFIRGVKRRKRQNENR